MYEAFYRLTADPFRLTPDPRFCFAHTAYAKARAYLRYALAQEEGFVVVTGRPGTGKTTLIEGLLRELKRSNVLSAGLASTHLEATELLRMIAYSFGVDVEGLDKATLLRHMEQFLVQQREGGRRVLLLIDEAQALSEKAFEELRLLADLQMSARPLMQIFLLGQEELQGVMHAPDMEPFQQRVVAACHLAPLDLRETKAYIQHRLSCANWQGNPELSGEAVRAVYQYSQGLPRHINKICSRLLLHGFTLEKQVLDEKDVLTAAAQLREEILSPLKSNQYGTTDQEAMATTGLETDALPTTADLRITKPKQDVQQVAPASNQIEAEVKLAEHQDRAPTPPSHDTSDTKFQCIDADSGPDRYGARERKGIARFNPTRAVAALRAGLAGRSARAKVFTARSRAAISLPSLGAWIRRGGIDYLEGQVKQLSHWLPNTSLGAAIGRQHTLIRSYGVQPVRTIAQKLGRWAKVSAPTSVFRHQSVEWARTFRRPFAANPGLSVLAGVLVGAALLTAGVKTTSELGPAGSGSSPAAQSAGMQGSVIEGQAQRFSAAMSHHESLGTAAARQDKSKSAARVRGASLPADSGERQPLGGHSARTAADLDLLVDSNLDAGTRTEDGQEPEFEGRRIRVPAARLEVAIAPIQETIGESLPPGRETSRRESDASRLDALATDVPNRTPVGGDAAKSSLPVSVATPAAASAARDRGADHQPVHPAAAGDDRPLRTALNSFAAVETTQALESAKPLVPVQDEDPRAPASAGNDAAALDTSRQQRVQDLLVLGRQALDNDRLLIPADNSAFLYYQRVLELEPSNDEAGEGIDRILARYLELAKGAVDRQDDQKARRFIARGLRVQPSHAPLLALRQRLETSAPRAEPEAAMAMTDASPIVGEATVEK